MSTRPDTEQRNPASAEIDRMSPLEIVRTINAEDAKVAAAVEQELPGIARAIEEIAARLRRGGRLIYVGAGTSGRLGQLDAAECPPTFNLPPETVVACVAGGPIAAARAVEDQEDSREAGQDDLAHLNVGALDVVVGIAASGSTPYVLGAIAYAKEQGALLIGLACNANTPLAREVSIMIAPLVGPEVLAGSTRLKAGTAQKMVLNMLSSGTMILLGKTFGNLMVDVQPTNLKLQRRAIEIVRQATGLASEQAAALFAACDGETRTAILAGLANLTPQEARAQLAAHGHNLRQTIDALNTRGTA